MIVSDLRTLHVAAGAHAASAEFTPAALSPSILARLRDGLENLIVDRSLRSHSLLRARWDAALARHREDDEAERDEVDVGEGVEGREQLPSPPSSEQPDSPSEAEATPRKLGSYPRFEKGTFGEMKSSLGLGFPGTPGARLRGRSGSV